MNRRTFLRRFTGGVVAAAVLAHVPAAVLKATPRLAESAHFWACDRLLAAYRAYANAHAGSGPAGMRVGREFFALYESEIPVNWRYVLAGNDDALMLRACRFTLAAPQHRTNAKPCRSHDGTRRDLLAGHSRRRPVRGAVYGVSVSAQR